MDAAGDQLFSRTELVPRLALDRHVVVQHDSDEAAPFAGRDQGNGDIGTIERETQQGHSLKRRSPGDDLDCCFVTADGVKDRQYTAETSTG